MMTFNTRQPSPARALPRGMRLEFEELGERVVPSAPQANVPIQQLVVSIQHDLSHLRSDVVAVQNGLGSRANATLTADLNNLLGNLAKVRSDIASGASFTADLNALLAAKVQLRSDLGARGGAAVQQLVRQLGRDLRTFAEDLANINKTVSGNLSALQSAGQTLMTGLAGNATVQADVQAINTALTNVTADIAAGTSATANIGALTSAINQLSTDLGTTASPTDLQNLRTFQSQLQTLSRSLGQINNVINSNLGGIQSMMQRLTSTLSGNSSATVQADVQAFNNALAGVATNISAGTSAFGDVGNAITAGGQLRTDLGTNASRNILRQFNTLGTNLMGLAIELGAVRV